MKWIIKSWPISTPFLAVYLTILLVLFVMKQNFALFLIWIQTPVYFLHQFEEYILPGGFITFFNTKVLGSGICHDLRIQSSETTNFKMIPGIIIL